MKAIVNYGKNYLRNNGHARGLLYYSAAALPVMQAGFVHWAENGGPKNGYEVVAVIIGAHAAGVVSVRAFLDTHLSKPHNETTPETPTQPVTTTTTTKPGL